MRLFVLVVAATFAVSGAAFAQAETQEHDTEAVPHQTNEGLMEHGGESAENPAHHGTEAKNAGQEHGTAVGGHEGGHSVPEYIFHHVTDDFAYEFEVPLNEGANPR